MYKTIRRRLWKLRARLYALEPAAVFWPLAVTTVIARACMEFWFPPPFLIPVGVIGLTTFAWHENRTEEREDLREAISRHKRVLRMIREHDARLPRARLALGRCS
jgi:hypothetical protein